MISNVSFDKFFVPTPYMFEKRDNFKKGSRFMNDILAESEKRISLRKFFNKNR